MNNNVDPPRSRVSPSEALEILKDVENLRQRVTEDCYVNQIRILMSTIKKLRDLDSIISDLRL